MAEGALLNSTSHLIGAEARCLDGPVGRVVDALFDDRTWTLRYLVVDAGSWLEGRRVLISPYAIRPQPDPGRLQVSVTQDQLRRSPPLEGHLSVTRQQERELLRHYNYPEYWWGANLWGASAFPYPPPPPPQQQAGVEPVLGPPGRPFRPEDRRLRSSAALAGHSIQATNDGIGTVQDLVFDSRSWTVRYIVVDTRRWWPGGRKVLVGVHWVSRIDWPSRSLFVDMTRSQVMASPPFEGVAAIHRDYEARLHANYGREGYWL